MYWLSESAILIAGYVFYGKWLAGQWGVDPKRKTPAFTEEDGVDYVPAKAPVLMGHHFSSIAGAGPINGPIQPLSLDGFRFFYGYSSAVSSLEAFMITAHCLHPCATKDSPSARLSQTPMGSKSEKNSLSSSLT
mgnify:CR=1 FL=1